MNHEETIRNYYAAWVRDDLDTVFALCADDLVAVNVPIGPIRGKPAVRAFFEKFNRGMSHKRYDVERIVVSLPYMSVFKFEGALIREWRDYFDLQTVLRQLGLPLDGSRPEPTTSPS